MKRKILISLLTSSLLIFIPARVEDFWSSGVDKISSMLSLIEENYFDQVNQKELIFAIIRGMLQTLDPHSYFLEPENFSRLKEEHSGKYHGLGIMIQKQEDRLVVISPIEGGPAYRLGIQAGDVISHINGESTKPISSFEAMQKLRGPKGTSVTITIVREGLKEPFELTVEREEIPLYSVPYAFILEEGIGYISIRNFSSTTTHEFEEKMERLSGQGMRKLILDLRENGGGTFMQSLELADEFLPKGALLVSIKGRNPYYNREFKAVRGNQYEQIPLVILINRGSASAPEIFCGAIRDNDRGLIVGEESWGKGLVQTVFPLGEELGIALSTAEYFTPSGASIQRDYTNLDDYMLSRDVPEEKREVRYTLRGRKVLAQGGIFPDYQVSMSRTALTGMLLLRGAFFNYARKFSNHKTPLSEKLSIVSEPWKKIENFRERVLVGKGIPLDERVIEDFKLYLQEIKIEVDPREFEEAREEIKRELEREIHSSLFGLEEGIKVYRMSDPVVLKAIEVLPEAESLIHEKSS